MLYSTLREAPAPESDSGKDKAGTGASPLYFNSLGIFGRIFRMVRGEIKKERDCTRGRVLTLLVWTLY